MAATSSRATPFVRFAFADSTHADTIARLRTAAAHELTARFGDGPWSGETSERAALASMRHSRVLVARRSAAIVGTCRLARKKPWAIDVRYFTPASCPLYLTDMAVRPDYQGRGVGRLLLAEAERVAHEAGADMIRLDAYDAEAGAGEFYGACGFTFAGRATYRGIPLLYYERPVGE